MAKQRGTSAKPRPRPKARPPARTPAMKSELKARAKTSSRRVPARTRSPRLATLLDALRRTRDDDELRLVYADALEEAGDLARADLVRAQTAVLRGEADAATRLRATALQADRDRALGGRAQRWLAHGGLVWHVEARVDEWVAHGALLFEADPITSITVDDPRDDVDDDIVAALARQPWLAHVHALEVPPYSELGDPGAIVELVGSPHLGSVTQLRLAHPLTAIAVAKHGVLPQLRALQIICEGSSEGDDAVRAFAATHRLTELELVGCGTSAAAMRTIAAVGWPLARLVTSGTHYVPDDLGAPGMAALAEAPALASLRELELEYAAFDDEALRALARSPYLRGLARVSFAGNHAITDDGIAMLADSPVIATVTHLNLRDTSVTARGRATLPDHVVVS